jgi:hypothetical protein
MYPIYIFIPLFQGVNKKPPAFTNGWLNVFNSSNSSSTGQLSHTLTRQTCASVDVFWVGLLFYKPNIKREIKPLYFASDAERRPHVAKCMKRVIPLAALYFLIVIYLLNELAVAIK